MKNGFCALVLSTGIVLSGFIVSNSSVRFDGVFPYLVLSVFSGILFYSGKPENIRNRRIFGIVLSWLFLLYATWDRNRPISETHYDVSLPPSFDVVIVFVMYPIGYFFGYLWGIAKRDLSDKY